LPRRAARHAAAIPCRQAASASRTESVLIALRHHLISARVPLKMRYCAGWRLRRDSGRGSMRAEWGDALHTTLRAPKWPRCRDRARQRRLRMSGRRRRPAVDMRPHGEPIDPRRARRSIRRGRSPTRLAITKERDHPLDHASPPVP
jgi:hypothetical protein